MEIEQKIQMLKARETKSLVEKLHQAEDDLEKAMVAEADFKAQSHGYLGSGDCQEVKRILAELGVLAPDTNGAGKKTTIPDKEAWLIKQRLDNKELADAITKQRQVNFLINDHDIKVEMARRRLEGIRAVLALTTQQIAFLATG